MLVSRQVILANVEATYNVDSIAGTVDPGNSFAVLVENPALSFDGLRMAERTPTRPSLAAVEKRFAGSLMQLTMDVELKGSGGTTNPPEVGALLQGCGFAQEAAPVAGFTYKPASIGHKSLTIYVYQDGMLFKLTGCRGTVTGNLAVGEVGKLSFTFSGHFLGLANPTDQGFPNPLSYDAVLPPPVVGANLLIDTFPDPIAAALTFDMGLTVSKPTDIAAVDGFGEIRITKRAVTGTVNPEGVVPTVADPIAQLKANNLLNIALGPVGTLGNDGYEIKFPKAQLTDVAQGDRDGIRTFDLSFAAMEGADLNPPDDNEIEINFGTTV